MRNLISKCLANTSNYKHIQDLSNAEFTYYVVLVPVAFHLLLTYCISMRKKDLSYNIFLSALMLVCLLFLLLVNLGDEVPRVIDAALNFGHVPLFGTVSIIILWILNNRKWPIYRLKYYVSSFTITVFLGVTTEVLQQLLTADRFFGISDLAHDVIGSVTFLILFYPFSAGSRCKLMSYKLFSVFLIILTSIPFLLVTIDTWNMNRSMPTINSFESRLEMARLSGEYESSSRSKLHATDGTYSLEINLAPGTYPGISLDYLYEDWREYDRLSFDTFLEGSTPLLITVRINDALHNQHYTDRFNKQYVLLPGANTIAIDLSEVGKAPRTRAMDMSRITNICIFSYRLKEPRTLFFDNFRLEKGSIQKR